MANPAGSIREHDEIARAIGAGKLDRAADLVDVHWRGGIDVVITWLRSHRTAAS